MADKKGIQVRVRDMDKVLFDGEVERISSFNEIGPFDVFPGHANFISIIKKHVTLYHNKQVVKDMPFEQAILKVKQDVAHIFLGVEAFAIDESSKPTPPQKNSTSSSSK